MTAAMSAQPFDIWPPAKIISVELDEENKEAKVSVMEDQLSLAIGKAGQNVRLAARLSGWKLDIKGANLAGEEEKKKEEAAPEVAPQAPTETAVETESPEAESTEAPVEPEIETDKKAE